MIENIKQSNRLVAIYGRVSSSHQENEGTIETQLSAVAEYNQKNNHIVAREYIDNGWSGDSIVRPALDQLRQDAKRKIWDAVVIYDPDRLARRYSYQELVMDELREAGIEVMFVTISAPKNSEDKILHGVRGLFAEYERAKITERFRLGKVRKANEGHIIASEAPYGYTFIKKNGKHGDKDFHQGYYEINKREAQIVENIFSWIAKDGLTLRGIVIRLQELSIAPRKSKRGVWSTSTLSTLLRNRTYIGEAHYQASYAVVPTNPIKKDSYKKIKKTSRRDRPESDWITIKTLPIIDAELFERVQNRLKSNFNMSMRNTKNEYLLSHRIWCTCGCRRAGEGPLQGKHLYYRCTNRVKSFPLASTCKEKALNARIVDVLVWQKIAALMSSPELLSKQAERWLNTHDKNEHASTVDIKETQKEIDKLKDQEDRYAKAYGAGAITIEQLKEYTLPIKEKKSAFEKEIAKAQLESDHATETVLPKQDDIKAFTEKATQELLNLNFVAKQAIVRNVIEKVVGTKEGLQVNGYIPLTNINVLTLHRHRRPAQRRQINLIQRTDQEERACG